MSEHLRQAREITSITHVRIQKGHSETLEHALAFTFVLPAGCATAPHRIADRRISPAR